MVIFVSRSLTSAHMAVVTSESKSVNWHPNWKQLDYKRQVPRRKNVKH